MSGNRLVHRIGRVVTRFLLAPGVRRLPLAESLHTTLYVAGKTLTERRERRFFREQVEPGMVVFDVGANVGFYTALLADLVGPAGRVHAFEPDPLSFGILKRRVGRRRNVELTRTALGARPGTATLHCGALNRADNRLHASHARSEAGESVEVPVTTLDAYCAERGIERIDILKMDVQGFEVAILEGFRSTLSRTPPRWMLIEFAPDLLTAAGSSPEDFWKILDEVGFEPWGLDQKGRAFRVEDTAAFTREYATGYTDVWAKQSQTLSEPRNPLTA